jgi:enoyl-[acyl-carrier-protein] reductase (NADH)
MKRALRTLRAVSRHDDVPPLLPFGPAREPVELGSLVTRAWSAEFASLGIRVNAISPGVVRDGGHDPADRAAVMMAGTPFGRVGTPVAIANAAVFLASDEAAFVHGTVLDVDGGRTGVAVIAGS